MNDQIKNNIIKSNVSERRAYLLKMMLSGKDDEHCQTQLNMDEDEYKQFKKDTFLSKANEINDQEIGEVYVEYIINQTNCIRDLVSLSNKIDIKKAAATIVTAIRARSDIYDKIIKTGQEFGILEKQPDRKEIAVAGLVVGRMNDDQLRNTILKELSNLEGMMADFDGKDILDIPVPEIYKPANKEYVKIKDRKPRPALPGHKTKSHKVSKGRPIIKKRIVKN